MATTRYLSEQCDKSDNEREDTCEKRPESVSTCMSHSLMSHFSLPHVAVIVEQSGLKNLKVDKALVDTGSQISLVSHAYLVRHNHDPKAIIPLTIPCSLKSATGRMMNPFKGKIKLGLRFCTLQNKLTRNIVTEFHVLEDSAQLENLLLGLNFLIPSVSVIEFKFMTMSLRLEKRFYKLALVDESCKKIYFSATEDGAAGSNMIICKCSNLILENGFYTVPDLYKNMLGSASIFLQPGSARKQTKNGNFSQQFMFEIVAGTKFTAGETLFYLEGPRQQPHKSYGVNYSCLEGNSSQFDNNHNGSYRSLYTVQKNWLNHPKSFDYNTVHRGIN